MQEIFDNINTNEDTVTDFHNDSQLLLDPESKLEDTSLTLVNDGVKTVQHDWESLKMRTDALSLRLVLYCPKSYFFPSAATVLTFACSRSTIETLEKGGKYVQS